MTLVLAASSPWLAVMASDRLVTLARGVGGGWIGDHDLLANKMVVLITTDAAVILGYSGSAYIGGIPTDNWIADVASPGANLIATDGSTGMFGFKKPNKLRFHQVLNRLRGGLSRYPEGAHVSVLVVGWRIRRGLRIPINIKIRSAAALGPNPDLRLRPTWPMKPRMQSVGAILTLDEFRAPLARRGSVQPWSSNSVINYFTDIIRNKAQSDRTVGPNVMSAVLRFDPHRGVRRVECCFDPQGAHYQEGYIEGQQSRQLVSYTPWFLTPGGFHAPTETTGEPGSAACFEVDGCTLITTDVPRAEPTPSNVGWAVPQPRRPMPGRR